MPDLNDQLMQELLHTFRDEAAEHIESINKLLLQFERSTNVNERHQFVQNAFRAAHSLKGAARAVSLTSVQNVAHAMEAVFQRVRDEKVQLTSESCDRLYDALDVIQKLLNGSEIDIDTVILQLNAMEQRDNHESVRVQNVDQNENGFSARNGTGAESSVDETIRVSLHKLDDLMAEVGELLVSRISAAQRMTETRRLNQMLDHWSKTWVEIKTLLKRHGDQRLIDAMFFHADVMHGVMEGFAALEQSTHRDVMRLDMVTNNLQDKVRQVRMLPFQVHSLLLERLVRDAARSEGKSIQFEIIGGEIELDKKVLELLKDPLVHLLRNAVSHGIETVDERVKMGKPEVGNIQIAVRQRGSEVHISVADDGRGFDIEKLQNAYAKRFGDGVVVDNPLNIAFISGVTTADHVTDLAGRGIGLDIVREKLEAIHGRITVESQSESGTTITLIVPTSLAITRTLLVMVGQEKYAIPLLSIEKISLPENITYIGGKPLLRLDGRNIPLIDLAALLDRSTNSEFSKQLVLLIAVGDQQLAITVNDVITEQELAVKPIGYPVKRVQNVTGVALLGDGQPIVILNPADLLHAYSQRKNTVSYGKSTTAEPTAPQIQVLVVDDSITTRTLERNILEAAGYRVITATDGVEALGRLQEHEIDVIVSDIEMPNMNGFQLVETIRADDKVKNLPIILVTSLESTQDRERGMLSGADAYIVKRGFDQAELLATIEQLA